jgi:hypothetical protein
VPGSRLQRLNEQLYPETSFVPPSVIPTTQYPPQQSSNPWSGSEGMAPHEPTPVFLPPTSIDRPLFKPDVKLDTSQVIDVRGYPLNGAPERGVPMTPPPPRQLVAPAVRPPNMRSFMEDRGSPVYAPPPAAPTTVKLGDAYPSVLQKYRRGGDQSYMDALANVDVPAPPPLEPKPGLARGAFRTDYDYQEYLRTGDWRQALPEAIAQRDSMASGSGVSSAISAGQSMNIADKVLSRNFYGEVASRGAADAARVLGIGQSALDLVTVFADHAIPGPGQGTVSNRYGQYLAKGEAPDQAAHHAMEDYGNALQQLAEDPNAPGAARAAAQGARVLGLVQSITAPAPAPGGASFPIALGIIKKTGEAAAVDAAKLLAKELRAGGVSEAEAIARVMEGTGLDDKVASRIVRSFSDLGTPAQVAANDALAKTVAERAAQKASQLAPGEGAALGFGATRTKGEVAAAEQRLVELNRERAVQGKPPLETLPPVTHEAGGNVPTRGFQIEKFPPEVQPFMATIAKALDPVLAASTKALSHEDIATAAQMIGEPVSKVAGRLAKRGVNSAEIQMVRQGVAAKVKVAADLAAQITRGQGTDKMKLDALAALQEAAAIQASLHEASSEAGRVLGVLRSQIDPALAQSGTELAYQAAISRIAKSPEHAAAIFEQLMKIGDDPAAIYDVLRNLNKASGWDQIMSIWNLPRAVKASFDLSAAGRQGLILSMSHPGIGKTAFAAQVRAFRSETFSQAIDRVIRTSPMQPIRQKAGLYLADIGPGAQMSAREEAFLTELAGHIPGMKASERAYVTYLNKLRADSFDEAILGWQRAGANVTDQRAKLLADWINVASGRGSFPQWAQGAAPLLNGIFFSPRFAVSRFQALTSPGTLAGKALFHMATGKAGLAADELAVSKLAAQDMAKYIGGNMVILGLAARAGADIETDPRSPEFLKIRVGDTLIDPWGGEQQVVRNMAQFITGEKKTVTGKNRGDIVPVARNEVAGRFLESKLSPSAGTVWDLGKIPSKADKEAAAGGAPWDQPVGVDFVGQSFTAKDLLTSTGQGLLIPMFISDVVDAIAADRAAGGSGIRGALLGSLSGLGVGVTTYSTDESHGASPKTSSGPDVSPYHR